MRALVSLFFSITLGSRRFLLVIIPKLIQSIVELSFHYSGILYFQIELKTIKAGFSIPVCQPDRFNIL